MIYKIVVITFLATSALSHNYQGWIHGQYSSFAKSIALWEWHSNGHNDPPNQPQNLYNEQYNAYPHQTQQWYSDDDDGDERNGHHHQPIITQHHWNNKGQNGYPSQPQNWYNEHYNTYSHQSHQWYNNEGNGQQHQPQHSNNGQNGYLNQHWDQPNQVNANKPNINQHWNQPNQVNANNPNRDERLKPPNALNGNNREAAPNQQALKSAPMYNTTHNPCTREIVKPNFKRPGRRITVEKCMDFIWEIKGREDTRVKNEECRIYRRDFLNISESFLIGGRVTEPGEFPHMVALGWKAVEGDWIFKCGGTIISPKFIVTAGHCTRIARDPKISNQVPQIVRIGAKNLVNNGSFYPRDVKIVKIIPHPNYKPPRQYFDIALMELEKKVEFDTNVQPACLWNNLNTNNLGTTASASGWGVTEIGGRNTTTELRVGDLDLIDNNVCNQLLRPMCNRQWCGLQEHQICAGKLSGGVDACQGDSGGPLQVRINLDPSLKGKMYYLLGVTSFGFRCARKNSPGVYTRISSFVDWIEQTVWPNEVTSG